LTSTST